MKPEFTFSLAIITAQRAPRGYFYFVATPREDVQMNTSWLEGDGRKYRDIVGSNTPSALVSYHPNPQKLKAFEAPNLSV